ncbi:hypothetical protein GF420_15785 [candidate division GN15 bacterium]|nr:hypothetical protein [candidate division GN15 bacterium]
MFNHKSMPNLVNTDGTYEQIIGPFILGKLDDFAKKGRNPGGFLTACLENNLSRAVGRADGENLEKIPAIALYIFNQLPDPCWGSPEKVANWKGLGQ